MHSHGMGVVQPTKATSGAAMPVLMYYILTGIRGRDARQDVVHQEQDGGDEIRQQVKGEHADRHDRPEPVEVHFRRARVIKAPSHKEATEQARQPAYPLSGQLVGRNGSCHMRSAQCME